jgi:hypothetical protein
MHPHPVTGARALYLDSTTMTGIAGVDHAAGMALLDELYEAATGRNSSIAIIDRSGTRCCGTTA